MGNDEIRYMITFPISVLHAFEIIEQESMGSHTGETTFSRPHVTTMTIFWQMIHLTDATVSLPTHVTLDCTLPLSCPQ